MPNKALGIKPDPWGKVEGASFVARGGFGEGGFDAGSVGGLDSFLGVLSVVSEAGGSLSTSIGIGPEDVC